MTSTTLTGRAAGGRLPQLEDGLFLTDGGLETTLIFHEGWELPMGEAFVLLDTEKGRKALRDYYDRYLAIAEDLGSGFVLESPTWRANPDWASLAGYDRERLAGINRAAIHLMAEVRKAWSSRVSPIVISGCIGPRGDGYDPGSVMSAEEAQAYHAFQAGIFAQSGADLVSAITMTNIPEAVGVARAAAAAGLPSVISFTLETDGKLPTGESLRSAIEAVDAAAADQPPAYYMVNCAHLTHYEQVLEPGADWTLRLKGLRSNSSRLSHAELDNAPELDVGDPDAFGAEHAALRRAFPNINVLGGCCGTDHRHVQRIAAACR